MIVPPETFQLEFLSKIQRLFAEGDFAATYKYALLVAIADLAVEQGVGADGRLTLSFDALGAKFVELYWHHALPYAGRGRSEAVLVQNNGPQAAVISAIAQFRNSRREVSLASAPQHAAYGALVGRVRRTVADQPVRYLQNFGSGRDEFLYEQQRNQIVLRPGIPYCMRRFQPLIQSVARTHWLEHIKKNARNAAILGGRDDLSSFLFGTPRRTVRAICGGLRSLTDGGRCFYCNSRAGGDVDVDHFVPLAMYPRNLAHNFVISCPACNRSKSDTLASQLHLEHWVEFVDRHADELADIGEAAGCPVDQRAARSVAKWAYESGFGSGSHAWVKRGSYEPISSRYLDYLQ